MPRDPKLTAAEARLKTAQDKARRRALGKPLALTDANLDAAALVGDQDAAAAEAMWDRDCSPEFRGLLSAQPKEST